MNTWWIIGLMLFLVAFIIWGARAPWQSVMAATGVMIGFVVLISKPREQKPKPDPRSTLKSPVFLRR